MEADRTKKSITNISYTIIGQVISLLVSFIGRIFFLRVLNTEYLGINGLFTNVLSVLSLVELGIGPAMCFSLYKPLAVHDTQKIKSLMRFYRHAYIMIGCAVIVLGMIFLPYYRLLINKPPKIPNLNTIYILFIANSGISYFYSYKRSIIICDQKQFLISVIDVVYKILLNLSQTIILVITRNYIMFLIMQIILSWAENVFISKIADKMYPYLKNNNVKKLRYNELIEIRHNITAMMLHQIGGVVVNATDNIVISRICGLVWVGMYSNYSLIIQSLTNIINQIFNAIMASVGNMSATESPNKMLKVFNRVFFMNFWISSFSSITLCILLNPFVQLWTDSQKYILAMPIVLSIVAVFYIMTMRLAILTFTNATGVFWFSRYKPIIESVINLVVSIILARIIGMAGVFIGTIVGSLATSFWVDPYVLYKYIFKVNMLPFFIRYLIYTVVTIGIGICMWSVCSLIATVSWIALFIKVVICFTGINGMLLFIFFKTSECRYSIVIVKKLIGKLFRRYMHKADE